MWTYNNSSNEWDGEDIAYLKLERSVYDILVIHLGRGENIQE